jgi:hypothetical protein
MEELDLLKAQWKNEKTFQKIPRNELYEMSHKKSSSIVKWILVISIVEFIFWLTLPLLGEDDSQDAGVKLINSLGANSFLDIMSYISYALIVIFCIIFYLNYKKIKLTDGSKNLMANILRVRKTVMYYINISLFLIVLRCVVMFCIYFTRDEKMTALFNKAEQNGKLFIMIIVATVISLFALAILIGIVYLYYKIIYGLLLKKLSGNYDDLKKNNL